MFTKVEEIEQPNRKLFIRTSCSKSKKYITSVKNIQLDNFNYLDRWRNHLTNQIFGNMKTE